MIEYRKGDLFDAPVGSILAHACNCKGVWGSGIAVDFKNKFPESFKKYKTSCDMYGADLLGTSRIFHENGYYVACMFTSYDYGNNVDTPEQILHNTHGALNDILAFQTFFEPNSHEIHMPKINSGRFRVPWEKTELILQVALLDSVVVVWELEKETK